MASVGKHGKGYRAQVFARGVRESKVFRTKREAEAWAAARETELREQAEKTPGDRHTLADAFDKYRQEISPSKRGSRWESIRIDAMLREESLPLNVPMSRIDPTHLSAWRDKRLSEVTKGTVLREFSLLSAIFESARREWRWIAANPVADVRKPAQPKGREVIIKWGQIKRMLKSLHYSPRRPVRAVSQAVAVCFLMALRTGMRAGELCGLEWSRVMPAYCRLPVTKTVPRDVPLTAKAMRLVGKMKGWDEDLVFGLKVSTLDAMFRKYRQRAGLDGFTFHDARHTAATRLATKVDVLTLCKIFGWSNPKMALRYYNPSAADIAKMLA